MLRVLDGGVVVPLLSKSQAQLVGAFAEVSVKLTASGAAPLVGVAEKLATGAAPASES